MESRVFAAAQLSATRRELEIVRGKILGLMQQVVATQHARDQALAEAEEQVRASLKKSKEGSAQWYRPALV